MNETNLDELVKYKERLKIALRVSSTCVFEIDLEKQLCTFMENAEDIFGIDSEEILQEVFPYHALSPVEYKDAIIKYFSYAEDWALMEEIFKESLLGKRSTYQVRMKVGKSDFRWCKVDIHPMKEHGEVVRVIGVITDINEMIVKTKALENKVKLDSFTGLYNKNSFKLQVEGILKDEGRKRHGLILMDLDDFKFINDRYGHQVGDAAIQVEAKKIQEIFDEKDIIGRFGGDEFVILVRDIQQDEKFIAQLEQLLEQDEQRITKSIGAAIYPDHGMDFESLFELADCALYQSKKGKNQYTISSISLSEKDCGEHDKEPSVLD